MRFRSEILAISLLCSINAAFAATPPLPVCKLEVGKFSASPATQILDGQVYTSTITVKGLDPVIWDVDVATFIRHTNSADLDVTVTSPKGAVVTLTTDNGNTRDNVFNGTVWDDQADPDGALPYDDNPELVSDRQFDADGPVGLLVPEEGLVAFKGEDPNGVWTLTVQDDSMNSLVGTLDSWRLDITSIPTDAPYFSSAGTHFNNNAMAIADNGTITSKISLGLGASKACFLSIGTNITHTFPADLDITLTSPAGKVATVITDIGQSNDGIFAGTNFSGLVDPSSQIPYAENPNIATDHIYALNTLATNLTPLESFGLFNGESLGGDWTLTIRDDANQDTGTLNSWSLGYQSCSQTPTDSDGDGAANVCDTCVNDPLKDAPGVCGCGVTDLDADNDGTPNCNDPCTLDPLKVQPGKCGCGTAESDPDGDGAPNCIDSCPNDAAKSAAGVCGCGTADTDSDGDGVANCNEKCAQDKFKSTPGVCGCGVLEIDVNGNGILDCLRNSELRSALELLKKAVQRVKPSLKGKKLNSVKAEVNFQLKAVQDYVGSFGGLISVQSGNDINKLVGDAARTTKKSLKLNPKDKKKALNAISTLSRAVL